MRSTSIRFLSLPIFCKLASAVSQAPPHASAQCALEDSECHRASLAKEQHDYATVFSEERDLTDVPWLDLEAGLQRLDPGLSLYTNVVHCWPSVGGIITAEHVHAVELACIGSIASTLPLAPLTKQRKARSACSFAR